jgi:hypothetical protein
MPTFSLPPSLEELELPVEDSPHAVAVKARAAVATLAAAILDTRRTGRSFNLTEAPLNGAGFAAIVTRVDVA